MKSIMRTSRITKLAVIAVLGLFLAVSTGALGNIIGKQGQPSMSQMMGSAMHSGARLPVDFHSDDASMNAPASQNSKQEYTADVTFTLRTNIADGKLVFVGVGGSIDGVVNPTLNVAQNALVQVTLTDGDGSTHDLTIPDFNVASDRITGKDASTAISFKADKTGTFVYFCSVPGHRAAGMEGKIIVGEASTQAPAGESISLDPTSLPAPIGNRTPQIVRVDLETTERNAQLADGATYTFWTFNGKIPGPFVRVRVGDTVEVHLKNDSTSTMTHSVDFHAVTGPGGGAPLMQTPPGEEKVFTFKALNPGLFVYHCATPMVSQHIANGMYGMILVEPEGGLPPVDKEFYVMQGEIYTVEKYGQQGQLSFSVDKLLAEQPEYFVFNGAVGALTKTYPLQANVGETVRIFFGVGGPNFVSSFHVIGEVFDRVYDQASLTGAPLTNVQTTLVPPGGATIVEFKLDVPGRYILVDHALARLEQGLAGFLYATGEANDLYYEGPAH